MRRSLTLLLLAAAMAAPYSFAQKAPDAKAVVVTEPGKGGAASVVTASAKVEAVDKANRTVTLKLPRGDSRTVTVGPEVKSFDRIKAGDTVKVEYLEALTVELKKGGKAVVGKTETSAMDKSRPGEKPGAVAQRTVTLVGDVVNVDAAKQIVTVKGKERQVDLQVRDPEQLKLVQKGDQVQATYTEAVAIALEPAPAAPAAPKK